MKKIIVLALIGVFSLVSCNSSKELLPLGELPLEKNVIESALATLEIPWTIGEENIQENDNGDISKSVMMHDENNKIIATISSSKVEGETNLSIIFMPKDFKGNVKSNLSVFLSNEWREQAIQLATILYGGFSSENEILEVFTKEYKEKTKTIVTENVTEMKDAKTTKWGKIIKDQYCFVAVEEKATGKTDDYLSSIMICSEIPKTPQYDNLKKLIELNN